MTLRVSLDDGRVETIEVTAPVLVYTPPPLHLRMAWDPFTDEDIAYLRENCGDEAVAAALRVNDFIRSHP